MTTAVAAPVALVAVAGALTLAAPANAAGGSNPLPFPTSVCGTASPTATSASASTSTSASASASASRSATATPQASASPSGTTPPPAKAAAAQPGVTSDPPSSSASASASKSAAAGGNAGPASPTPATPTPTPSASSSSSSGGFWGWLNGVWTFIVGAVQVPHAAAAPAVNAAYVRTLPLTHNQAHDAAASTTTTQSPTPTPTASCLPKSAIKPNTANSGGDTAAEIPWHLSTPSMTMYSLTYNGVTTIKTDTGSLKVLDFTAAKVTLDSMVTYSHQGGGKLQYVDGGQGQTVTLINPHLMTTSITANVLGLIHQTFTPDSPGLLIPLQGITIPIPVLFTDVEADNAFLNTREIVIPGFNGHGN